MPPTLICDLVIPARDERANVDALFDALATARAGLVRHVVIGDNGSSDGTAEACRDRGAVVVSEPRRGYGAACLKALAWIGEQPEPPDVVAFLDADLADDPAALGDLLAPLQRGAADFVIGSRVRRAESGALNRVQRSGNGLACSLMALLGGRRYTDLGPFRAVRWAVLQRLAMADQTWGWTVEMQMKAALLDVRSLEVDVPYRMRGAGRSKISGTVRGVAAAGTKIIGTIFALWWRRRSIIEAGTRAADHTDTGS